jgi:hypothetical protein
MGAFLLSDQFLATWQTNLWIGSDRLSTFLIQATRIHVQHLNQVEHRSGIP